MNKFGLTVYDPAGQPVDTREAQRALILAIWPDIHPYYVERGCEFFASEDGYILVQTLKGSYENYGLPDGYTWKVTCGETEGGERGTEQGVGRVAPERPKPIGTSERRA